MIFDKTEMIICFLNGLYSNIAKNAWQIKHNLCKDPCQVLTCNDRDLNSSHCLNHFLTMHCKWGG